MALAGGRKAGFVYSLSWKACCRSSRHRASAELNLSEPEKSAAIAAPSNACIRVRGKAVVFRSKFAQAVELIERVGGVSA